LTQLRKELTNPKIILARILLIKIIRDNLFNLK
jgi:hypothetical protein